MTRDYKLPVRMNEKEREIAETRAAEKGMTVGAYFRLKAIYENENENI